MLVKEVGFEKKLNIHTSGLIPSKSEDYYHYQPAAFKPLQEIFGYLPRRDFQFYDIGSGKGRVAFFAEHMGFTHITGIELISGLTEQAVENLAHYKKRSLQAMCCTSNTQTSRPSFSCSILSVKSFSGGLSKR
jgi:SAM-dependent methyltransferase